MKIESTDQDIRTMLSSGYYRIPRFQRPYSWDRENIQEFWDDIVRDNPSDYFIGSLWSSIRTDNNATVSWMVSSA